VSCVYLGQWFLTGKHASPVGVKEIPGGPSLYAPYNMESLITKCTNDYICFCSLFNPLTIAIARPLFDHKMPAARARELFKPSTDSASLLVDIEKKHFSFSVEVFWRWRHNEGMFWKFWSPLAGPGPQPIDPFYWLKVLLKIRSKSTSIEIDLLAYLQPKLWVKNSVFGPIQNFSEKVQFALSGQTLANNKSAADWARELFKPCNN